MTVHVVAVSPEEIGPCGCWRAIAARRESLDPTAPRAGPAMETGCCASSLSEAQAEEAALLEGIRGHWSAIENGTHYRRDVTFVEDVAARARARDGQGQRHALRGRRARTPRLKAARARASSAFPRRMARSSPNSS